MDESTFDQWLIDFGAHSPRGPYNNGVSRVWGYSLTRNPHSHYFEVPVQMDDAQRLQLTIELTDAYGPP